MTNCFFKVVHAATLSPHEGQPVLTACMWKRGSHKATYFRRAALLSMHTAGMVQNEMYPFYKHFLLLPWIGIYTNYYGKHEKVLENIISMGSSDQFFFLFFTYPPDIEPIYEPPVTDFSM